MYKCTECNAIFEECPDYCDCGNDIFEEITNNNSVLPQNFDTDNYQIQRNSEQIPRRKKLSMEEIREIKAAEDDHKKARITVFVSIFICRFVFASTYSTISLCQSR